MNRIPSHTLDDAPDASRPMLEHFARQSRTTGRILHLHAEMAHAPVLLAAYHGMRRAFDEHATLDARTRTAVMLATSAVQGCAYTGAIHALLARSSGWSDESIADIESGSALGDPRLDALLEVVRAAAARSGRVEATTWDRALQEGWSPAQLLEAYASLGLSLFTGGFVHFAETPLDVPAGLRLAAPAAGELRS